MSQYLTIAMLRDFLDDRLDQVAHKRGGDLLWDDATLQWALEDAVRSYRSIPPFIDGGGDASSLPVDSNLWLNGAAGSAARRKLRSLRLEAVQFQAGNITTAPDKEIIDGLTALAKECSEAFAQEVQARKATRQFRSTFFRA